MWPAHDHGSALCGGGGLGLASNLFRSIWVSDGRVGICIEDQVLRALEGVGGTSCALFRMLLGLAGELGEGLLGGRATWGWQDSDVLSGSS